MNQTPRLGGLVLCRAARSAVTIAALGGVAATLRWSMGYPAALARSLTTASPAFEQLLASTIALMAWVVVGWAAVVVIIELAAALPGAIGRRFANLARIVTPAAVRRFAQAAIGFTVFVGPMTAGRALAADAGTPSLAPTAAVVAATPTPIAPRLLTLDRPGIQGHAAIDLDRPAQPALPRQHAYLGSPTTSAPATTPLAATTSAPPKTSLPPAATRTPSPSAAALAAGVPQREAASPTYVVRRGDALWDVAARHLGPSATAADIAREWPRWYAANRDLIGHDPNLIHPGDVLVPPSV